MVASIDAPQTGEADPKVELTHTHPESGKKVGPTDSQGNPWLTKDELKEREAKLVRPAPKVEPTERPDYFPQNFDRYQTIKIRDESIVVDRWALPENALEAALEKGVQRGPNDAGGSRDYRFQEREAAYKFLQNWYDGITTGRGGVRAVDDEGRVMRTIAEGVAKRWVDAAIGSKPATDVDNSSELSAESIKKFVVTACEKVEGGVQFPFIDQTVVDIQDDGTPVSRKVSKSQNKVKAIGSLANLLLESKARGPVLKAQAAAMIEAMKKAEGAGELEASDEI